MKLAGRISAAVDVLKLIEQQKLPISKALSNWGLANRFAGVNDRSAIGNIVYDAFRYKRLITYFMGEIETPTTLAFGAYLLASDKTAKALIEEIKNDKFLLYQLDDDNIDTWDRRFAENAPLEEFANIPDWLMDPFKRVFNDEWVIEAFALSQRPPLDLRVNTLKADKKKVMAMLKNATELEFCEELIRFPSVIGSNRHPNVTKEQGYIKGWFEIQDLGSQLVTKLLPLRNNMQLLDYCAGAGGKSLALSALMKNQGQIYAYDVDKNRLAPIYERVKRAGSRNIQILQNKDNLVKLQNKMDIILLDVPCSGSGVWRRHPELKWKLSERYLNEIREKQQQILWEAPIYLKKEQSFLVYITCSILEEENNLQIQNFLKHHPNFKPLDLRILWDKLLAPENICPLFTPEGVLFTPNRTLSDGFFISILSQG